jgi:hypothetical protein
MVKVKTTFGSKKPANTAERIERFVRDSSMILSVFPGIDYPNRIWIEIRGKLANIPAIKNNRNPRFPGIDRVILAKMRALDMLFAREARLQGLSHQSFQFGRAKIFVSIITAASNSGLNEDNVLTTIKDWLEPRTKQVGGKNKKARGWGIGLIQDDITARGIAIKSEDLDSPAPYTRIVIEPFTAVKESLVSFFETQES